MALGVGQAVALSGFLTTWGGKSGLQRVRVPGNAWGVKAYGKCHREYTAETE